MENSDTFSLDSNLPHSFFSSFSSSISTTSTWKPILSSLQENQRLSRLIQVRETRLQELSSNTNMQSHSRLSSGPFAEDLPSADQDRLSEILHLSQKNLKILSFKVGSLPNNLLRAIDLVLEDPSSMSTTQKFECLSAIELLREKLSDLVLNSEEILSFFKDIVLECEASAANFKSGQEGLLHFADKREEIFLSKDLNRVKIQNLHRLVMNLESWKRRKGIFVEELDSNSRIQYDECIKETIEKLGKKEQEVIDMKNHFNANFSEIRDKVKNLKSGLKRLRHCVEFEMFNTWSSLIGQEFSNEPSCHQIIKKISSFQESVQKKNTGVKKRFDDLKKQVGLNKSLDFTCFGELQMFFEKGFQMVSVKVLEQVEYAKKIKDELKKTALERDFLKLRVTEMNQEIENIRSQMNEKSEFFEEQTKKMKQFERDKKLEILEKIKQSVSGFKVLQLETQEKYLQSLEFFSHFLQNFKKIENILKNSYQLRLEQNVLKSEILLILETFNENFRKHLKKSLFSLFSSLLSLIKSTKLEIDEEKIEAQRIVLEFSEFLSFQVSQITGNAINSENLVKALQENKENIESQLKIENSDLNLEVKNLKSQLLTLQESKKRLKNRLNSTQEDLAGHLQDFEDKKFQLEKENQYLYESLKELEKKVETCELTEQGLTEKLLEKNQEMRQKLEEMSAELIKNLETKDRDLQEKSEELSVLTLLHQETLENLQKIQDKLVEKEAETTDLQQLNQNLEDHLKTLSISNDSNLKKIDQLSSSLSCTTVSLSQKSSELFECTSSLSALQEKAENLSKDLNNKSSLLDTLSIRLQEQKSLNESLHQDFLLVSEKLKQMKSLESQVKALQVSNQNLRRSFGDFNSEFLKDLESFKSFLMSSSEGQEAQSLKVLALESSNSHLQSENSRLSVQVFHLQEQNLATSTKSSQFQSKMTSKLAKLKRKTRTFALVLAHERGLIKDLHQDWMIFVRNSLENLKIILQSFQELKVSDDKKARIEIQRITKESQEKCRKIQVQMDELTQLMSRKEQSFEQDRIELTAKLENMADEKNKTSKKIQDLQSFQQRLNNENLEISQKSLENERKINEKLRLKEQEIQELIEKNRSLNQDHLDFYQRSEMVKNDLIGTILKFNEKETTLKTIIERLELEKSVFNQFLQNSGKSSAGDIQKLLKEKTDMMKNHELKLKDLQESLKKTKSELESVNVDFGLEIMSRSRLESEIKALKSENEELRAHSQSQQLELGFLLTGKNFSEKSNSEKDVIFKDRLEKILKCLTGFRELNNVLRANALKLLSSSSFEIEAFRIKLFEHVRFDISRIRSDLEGLMDQYKEERGFIHDKIDSIKSSLEQGSDLSVPVKDYLKENQESIDALNETFERSSQAYQQNIEENIKKVEDLRVKVESFRSKGYDLLNKYKRDSVLIESHEDSHPDYVEVLAVPSQEELKEASFNCFTPEESSTCSSSNMLLSKIDKQSRATVRLPHLIKTLERYLNNKYKDDLAALEKGNNPLPMQEYIYQSLFNESQLLADKKLTELMNTLKENQHDRRIKLYCRLLQVYDPNPISYKLSLYIIQMRNEFNRLVSKQVIPKTHTKRVDGMQVLNLLGAVRALFGADVETGKVVLKHLKPENMLSTVWTITCLEYFFYKNMVPDKCFLSITKQETMTEQEFVYGLSRLDTFVSEDDLQELFTSQFTGLISLQEFMNLFNLDSLFERNQIYLVDQLHFLNSLIEGYNAMRIRHYKEVEKLIQAKCAKKLIPANSGKKLMLTWDETNSVLTELGTNAEQVFGFASDVSSAELKKKIFELNLGGKGIGCYNLRVIKGISDTDDMLQAR